MAYNIFCYSTTSDLKSENNLTLNKLEDGRISCVAQKKEGVRGLLKQYSSVFTWIYRHMEVT